MLRVDDSVYPRKDDIRLLRKLLLYCRWFLGVYVGAVAVNLYVLLTEGLVHLTNPAELIRALVVTDAFSSRATSPVVYIIIATLFTLLALGGVWATADVAHEHRVLGRRRERKVVEGIEAALKRDQSDAQRDPDLLMMSILGDYYPTMETLRQESVTVGRDTSNTIQVRDSDISRREMQFINEGQFWRVVRCPGAAPLRVNGQELPEAMLRPRDQIVAGKSVFRFEASERRDATVAAEPVPKLVVSIPDLNVTFVAPLRRAKITLGREPDCGIVVPSKIVGGYHAELTRVSDGTYEIRNLGSRNGLQFHGRRISTHTFRDKETVTIGAASGVDFVALTYVPPDYLPATVDGWSDIDDGDGL